MQEFTDLEFTWNEERAALDVQLQTLRQEAEGARAATPAAPAPAPTPAGLPLEQEQQLREELQQVQGQLQQAQGQLQQVQGQLAGAQEQEQQLQQEVADARAAAAGLQERLQHEQQQAQALQLAQQEAQAQQQEQAQQQAQQEQEQEQGVAACSGPGGQCEQGTGPAAFGSPMPPAGEVRCTPFTSIGGTGTGGQIIGSASCACGAVPAAAPVGLCCAPLTRSTVGFKVLSCRGCPVRGGGCLAGLEEVGRMLALAAASAMIKPGTSPACTLSAARRAACGLCAPLNSPSPTSSPQPPACHRHMLRPASRASRAWTWMLQQQLATTTVASSSWASCRRTWSHCRARRPPLSRRCLQGASCTMMLLAANRAWGVSMPLEYRWALGACSGSARGMCACCRRT